MTINKKRDLKSQTQVPNVRQEPKIAELELTQNKLLSELAKLKNNKMTKVMEGEEQ